MSDKFSNTNPELYSLAEIRKIAFEEGKTEGIFETKDEIKKALAELLDDADNPRYSFSDGHWGLVFSVFAKRFHLGDSEIYELAETMKGTEK